MTFSEFERSIVSFFYDQLPIKGDIQIKKFEYDQENWCRTGYGMLGDESDPIRVIFSIPQNSDDLYFIICDGDPDELSGELAGLQQYNERIHHLCLHHTVPTDSSYVKESGWFGYLISSPAVTWSEFPSSKEIVGRDIRFRLVMPISNEDREIKMNGGVDALMDKYQKEKRELFTFKRQA